MNPRHVTSLALCLLFALPSPAADLWQTLDLRAFTNRTAVEKADADGLVPHGRQVFDGTLFQVDGFVQLGRHYTGAAQTATTGTSNITLTVGRAFAELHLLTALEGSAPESNAVTRVILNYEDGSTATLQLTFGDQVRRWDAALHKTERSLRDSSNAAIAWIGQPAQLAGSDRYARLFHAALNNPHPASSVKSLNIARAHTNCWPIIAGVTLASAEAPRLTNTVNLPASPFPDMRRRNGDPAVLTGIVRTREGKPVTNALIRAMAERGMSTAEYQASRLSGLTNISTRTDAGGRFELPALRDDRLYHVLVATPGDGNFLYPGADPKSEPLDIRLQKSVRVDVFSVHVKLVDESGAPVVGALIEPDGVSTGTSRSWGGYHGFPSYTASDAEGKFQLGRGDRFTAVQLSISAHGLATLKLWVDASNTLQTVTLNTGATVQGRVAKNGQPVTNVTVSVSGVDRSSDVYVGQFAATTDTNGVFTFEHVPVRTSFWLFGQMNSFKEHGALQPQQILTAAPGQTNDLGDLEVKPGLRLAGQIKTRRGELLPKDLRLSVSFEHGDSQSTKPDTNGNFEFRNLPSGLATVYQDQGRWRLSSVNRSLDTWGNRQLVGLFEQDKDDLLVVIESGEQTYGYNNNGGGQLPQADQARSRPLFGAEASGPIPITLAGQVVDHDTGQPVRAFTVVPGRKPPAVGGMVAPSMPLLQKLTGAFRKPQTPWNELPWWDNVRTETFSNGVFSVDYVPLTSTPMFRVEAPGYEPFISDPVPTKTTNLVIRLSTGSGPSGIVLLPDGKPAGGAQLWYAVTREQSSLFEWQINRYGNNDAGQRTTGADGRFAFPARSEGRRLFVSHTNGWADLDVTPDSTSLKLTLTPWAAVTGTLVSSNGAPMPGVPLHLTIPYDWNNGDPILNMQSASLTDTKGRFFFTNAPPIRLDLIREIPSGGGYMHGPQTWFICKPGITNDLGKVLYDSPPPPPFSEKVRKTLGL
jgi:hypothetical protein